MFNLIKFFFSIRFLMHFLLGILLCFTFFIVIFFSLQFITNHNDKIKVPNLESLNLSQVSKELNEISKILPDKGNTTIKIKISDKNNNYSFQLKNKRNIDRKTINLLRNKEISAIIG